MDRSGSMDGQIKRWKSVLTAIALFLLIGFSIWIIFIMGEPIRTQLQDAMMAQFEMLMGQ